MTRGWSTGGFSSSHQDGANLGTVTLDALGALDFAAREAVWGRTACLLLNDSVRGDIQSLSCSTGRDARVPSPSIQVPFASDWAKDQHKAAAEIVRVGICTKAQASRSFAG